MVYLVCIILLWISREDKTKWMPFIRRKLFLCFWKVVLYVDYYFNLPKYKFIMLWFPTGTSSSIRHRFDVEIPRGKFVEITSILKGESTWKLWHRFDVDSTFKIDEISMSSPCGFFYVVSTSNRRNFCTRCFHSIIF